MKFLRTSFFAVLTGCILLSAEADDSVLLWMVNTDTVIKDFGGSDIGTIFSDAFKNSVGGQTVNAVRIRVDGYQDDFGDPLYLSFFEGENGNYTLVPEMTVMTVKQDSSMGGHYAGPTWAALSTGGLKSDMSFMMELGNYNGNDDTWSVLAQSELHSFTQLFESGHISPGELAMPIYDPWNPPLSVPEPTGGLLVLIGGGLLVLRRRRDEKSTASLDA